LARAIFNEELGAVKMATKERAGVPVGTAAVRNELDVLEQFGSTVTVQRDEELYGQGDVADCCWRVLTGCVRKVELLEDGRRHLNAFLLPGDLFGLDDLDTRHFVAEAVTLTTLRRYPRGAVEALAKSNPALSLQLAALTIAKLHAAHQRMVLLSRKTSTERLASFVLEMDRRIGPSGASLLNLPMGRADIADYLGLTTETVCRVLTQMIREGTVRLARTRMEICDRPKLHTQAGVREAEGNKLTAPQVWRHPVDERRGFAA